MCFSSGAEKTFLPLDLSAMDQLHHVASSHWHVSSMPFHQSVSSQTYHIISCQKIGSETAKELQFAEIDMFTSSLPQSYQVHPNTIYPNPSSRRSRAPGDVDFLSALLCGLVHELLGIWRRTRRIHQADHPDAGADAGRDRGNRAGSAFVVFCPVPGTHVMIFLALGSRRRPTPRQDPSEDVRVLVFFSGDESPSWFGSCYDCMGSPAKVAKPQDLCDRLCF